MSNLWQMKEEDFAIRGAHEGAMLHPFTSPVHNLIVLPYFLLMRMLSTLTQQKTKHHSRQQPPPTHSTVFTSIYRTNKQSNMNCEPNQFIIKSSKGTANQA
eukprot:5197036-Amphidinium_carterae.1